MDQRLTRYRVLAGAAVLLCAVVVPISAAWSTRTEPGAQTSASISAQVKKLKKQVKKLKREQGSPRPPSGPAGGELAGEYPNPSVAGGALGTGAFSSSIPAARVTRSVAQTIPFQSNAATTLLFDLERYDTAGLHDDASISRLTAPATGIYVVTAEVSWAAGTGDFRVLSLRKNGAVTIARANRPPMASGTTAQSVSTEVRLEAGDYVEVNAFFAGPPTIDILKQPDFSPEFAMTWLAPGP